MNKSISELHVALHVFRAQTLRDHVIAMADD